MGTAVEPNVSEAVNTDRALRAMTDDGAFRVVTVRTTDLVAELLRRKPAGMSAAHVGELVTGAILVRETMSPGQRLQAIFRTSDQRGRIVADSHPDGSARGLLTLTGGLEAISLSGGTLEMMRTLYNGELHRGTVQVPEGGGMSQALMVYMSASEQVATMTAVACIMDGERVQSAGGYIVQLLPEVGTAPLAIMTERLRDFEDVGPLLTQTQADPALLLSELLYGMDHTSVGDSPLSFGCQCSAVRVLGGLATVGRAELQDMVDAGKVLEIDCDYCGENYRVSPSQLRGLLDQS